MKESLLREKSKNFAKEIITTAHYLKKLRFDYALADQILRSGTSIGANIFEAQYAPTTKDFINKLTISQKECHETLYWLELLYETSQIDAETYHKLQSECVSIQKILSASVKTARSNMQSPNSQ